MWAGDLVDFPQRFGFGPSGVVPRRQGFGGADELPVCVVVPLDRGGSVVDGEGYSETRRGLESPSLSCAASDASRDSFGTSTPPRFSDQTADSSLS